MVRKPVPAAVPRDPARNLTPCKLIGIHSRKPAAHCTLRWAVALVLGASACEKDRARDEPDAQALAELRAIAEGNSPSGLAVDTPAAPDEPPPSKPELAHEVPDILAELEADPAYRGIWEPERREDLDVVLSGMSAVLTESPVPKALVDTIKERQLERVISRPMAIRNRIGKLPDAFADRLRAHLAATKDEPQLGFWLTPAGGRIRDYAAVAVYVEPNKPEYLRELVAARAAGVGQWTPVDENPARPWLATERGVLERLSALTTLTAAEQHRLDELRGERASRGGDATTVANDLGAGAIGTKHIGLSRNATVSTLRRSATKRRRPPSCAWEALTGLRRNRLGRSNW